MRTARCQARSAEAAWERAIGKTPPDAWSLDVECDFIVPPPLSTSAVIVLGLVGLPGILLSVPFILLEASLGDSGIALHYVAWLVGIALFWKRVGAWFDETLSDDPDPPKPPQFLVRFYFGCLLWLSPLVLLVVGLSSFSHHHTNNILELGVFVVWSGLGTFLLVRRFWNNDGRTTESINQDPQL